MLIFFLLFSVYLSLTAPFLVCTILSLILCWPVFPRCWRERPYRWFAVSVYSGTTWSEVAYLSRSCTLLPPHTLPPRLLWLQYRDHLQLCHSLLCFFVLFCFHMKEILYYCSYTLIWNMIVSFKMSCQTRRKDGYTLLWFWQFETKTFICSSCIVF